MKPQRVVLIALCFAASGFAQERFQSGEFKGFTKSPTEHIISRVDKPITLATVRCTIVLKGKDEAIKEVVFEIRGPGNSERVRATKTDDNGRANIARVPEGIYVLKATRDGFQSVAGTLVVSKKAEHQKDFKIEMPLGV